MWNRAGKSTRYSLLQLVKECSGQLRRKICTKSFNKICTKPNHTTIEWQDGHVSEFHNTWLRDHCRCEKCIDPSTFQRSFDTLNIANENLNNNSKMVSIHENNETNEIIIEWEDSLDTKSSNNISCTSNRFPSKWLRNHCYSESERNARTQAQKARRTGWAPEDLKSRCSGKLPYVEHTELMDDTNFGLKKFIEFLDLYGIVFIQNCPVSIEETEKTVRRFGRPRDTTPWGLMWDTKPNDAPKDTAYTNVALLPHNDCCYLEDQVALQVFNCVAKAGEGGASTWIDGFKVAETIEKQHPEVYSFFSNVNLPYFCVYDGVDVRSEGPVFEHDPNNGILKKVRFNNYDRAPLEKLTSKEVAQFYEYLPIIYNEFRDEKYVLKHTLDVGEMVVIDNWRVLHGRDEFQGYRNLRGCYVGRDDIDSTKRQFIHDVTV